MIMILKYAYLICGTDLLKLFCCSRLFVDIRMVLQGMMEIKTSKVNGKRKAEYSCAKKARQLSSVDLASEK